MKELVAVICLGKPFVYLAVARCSPKVAHSKMLKYVEVLITPKTLIVSRTLMDFKTV